MSSPEFLIQIHGILFEFRAEIRLELRDSFGNTCPSEWTIKLPEEWKIYNVILKFKGELTDY